MDSSGNLFVADTGNNVVREVTAATGLITTVAGTGTIEVVKNGPRLDLQGKWHDFRWPLIGKEVPFRSPSGEFTLRGILPYDVHLNGIARVRDLPPMPAQVD